MQISVTKGKSKKSLQKSYQTVAFTDEMHIFNECIGLVTEDIYKRIYYLLIIIKKSRPEKSGRL